MLGAHVAGIDFGNHQRHAVAHAKRRAVVDDVRAALDQRRRVASRWRLRRSQRRRRRSRATRLGASARLERRRAPREAKRPKRIDRNVALLEHAQDRLADDAGRADDATLTLYRASSPTSTARARHDRCARPPACPARTTRARANRDESSAARRRCRRALLGARASPRIRTL